jgi:hypothetical protein
LALYHGRWLGAESGDLGQWDDTGPACTAITATAACNQKRERDKAWHGPQTKRIPTRFPASSDHISLRVGVMKRRSDDPQAGPGLMLWFAHNATRNSRQIKLALLWQKWIFEIPKSRLS